MNVTKNWMSRAMGPMMPQPTEFFNEINGYVYSGPTGWRREDRMAERGSKASPTPLLPSSCRKISETDGLAFGAPVALGPFEDAGA